MKATILITGGAGYIGSAVSHLLMNHGYQVIILDNFLHNQPCTLPTTIITGDYGDSALLQTIFTQYTIDTVIHCGALIEVGVSVRDPLPFYNNNVTKTITLLEMMHKHAIKKMIFSSSAAVYGAPEYTPIDETHPKNPINPYGKTKLMIEMVLEDMHRAYGLNYVIFRYFNAAGALPEYNLGEQHKPETHLIPLLFQALYTQKPFTIYGSHLQTKDGSCVRDYVHIADIAHAHQLALNHLDRQLPSDVFNIGTGRGVSVKHMIQTIESVTRGSINTITAPSRPGDPHTLVADASKAGAILQWKPHYSDLPYIIKSSYAYTMLHASHGPTKTFCQI